MTGTVERLVVSGEAGAVGRARTFAVERAAGVGRPDLGSDVALVVSELVTNALLHGSPPIEVSVAPAAGGVRVEVADRSRVAPLQALADEDSMTGRGLALIGALSSRWGADPTRDGKVVWAELTGGASDAATVDLTAWENEVDGPERRFTIELGDVPTDLLLAAKAHVDNLVREFALAAHAEDGRTRVPPELAHLVEAVVHGFAEARQSIRRQALDAMTRGQERTTLVLTLPASAADAGLAYLAGLDDADVYARAARLLTLETPPQHRAFRRWYVEALVEQLREVSAGRTPPPPPSLERRLLDELGIVAMAQRATARAARLHAVAAAFVGATTVEDVAAVAVGESYNVLGATRACVLLRDADGTRWIPASAGYTEETLRQFTTTPEESALPILAALRSGEPVWVESRKERDERFPLLAEFEPTVMSVCAVPVSVSGAVRGVLRYSFDVPHLFDDDERRFVTALAAQTAQALDRALTHAAEQRARASAEETATRLARLQRVTAELASVNDVGSIADVVVSHAAQAVGAVSASLSVVVDDETLEVVRQSESIRGLGWSRYPADTSTPAGEAVVTNQVVKVRTGAETDRRYPALAGQTTGDRSLICLPLSVGDHPVGVIALSFPEGQDLDPEAELGFLLTLADTCAQAIDRARALAEARASAEKLSFLADASSVLATSLDYRTTLTNVARLVVPRLADWCSIVLIEDGELQTVAVSHADPDKVELAAQVQRDYPTRLDRPGELADVLATGRSALHPVITDEMLEAGAVDERHLALLREIGMTSAMIVPLQGRSGVFGAISLVSAASGTRYSEDELVFAEDLTARVAVAVENAVTFRQQSGRLAAITRVAEAAQHAILAPVPERVGPLRLSAAYVSAARDALVGGDLYEVVRRETSVRLIIGDVRGKGLDAVRLATVVLGEFRAAAVERDSLADVATQMDQRLLAFLGDEDFVTVLLADVASDGACRFVTCGHPPAYLSSGGTIRRIGAVGSPPLGLGVVPVVDEASLAPGDRLLLFTDGLIEARGPDGRFADVDHVIAPLRSARMETALDEMLTALRHEVGGDLGDDLAMLLAEFDPQ